MLELLRCQDTLQHRVVPVNLSTPCLERLTKPITLTRVSSSALKRCDVILIFCFVILAEHIITAMNFSVPEN